MLHACKLCCCCCCCCRCVPRARNNTTHARRPSVAGNRTDSVLYFFRFLDLGRQVGATSAKGLGEALNVTEAEEVEAYLTQKV